MGSMNLKKPTKYERKSQNPLVKKLVDKGKQSKAYRASSGLEKSLAKRSGGYRTAGSGNKKEKGDVRISGVARIEHKATTKKSFRVTTEILDKIENAARGCDEVPVLVVDFLDINGRSNKREIACLPLNDLLDLIDDTSS